MEPEGIVEFQSANSINDIHDPELGSKLNDLEGLRIGIIRIDGTYRIRVDRGQDIA
jgi:hypothetical protein